MRKDLNENEQKVLGAVIETGKGNGGDFTFFSDVFEYLEGALTENQIKGYISDLQEKDLISVGEPHKYRQIFLTQEG